MVSRSSASWPGCCSSARVPSAIMFAVVSFPALQVVEQLLGRQRLLRGRVAVDQDLGVVLEEAVAGIRHAQQLAQHQRRRWQGERLDQIHRLGASEHVVDQAVDDLLGDRPQRLHPLDDEGSGHHPAQPGVLWVVHGDGGLFLLAIFHSPHRLMGIVRVGAVGTEVWAAEQGPLVGAAGDQPRRAAVPQPDLRDRAFLPQGRRRVERAAAQVGDRILRKAGRNRFGGRYHGVRHDSLLP